MVDGAERKFADYVLYYKRTSPFAVVEARQHTPPVGDGMANRALLMPDDGRALGLQLMADASSNTTGSGQQRRPEHEAFPCDGSFPGRACGSANCTEGITVPASTGARLTLKAG